MTVRSRRRCLVLLAALAGSACVEPDPSEPSIAPGGATHAARIERARRSARGDAPAPTPRLTAVITPAQGQAMVNALDLPAALRPTFLSGVSPDPDATRVIETAYGEIRPTRNTSFLLLSTGASANMQADNTAEPGTDFPPGGPAGDIATLRFRVTVPPGLNRLSFDYTFLSAESPDFLGSLFNDTFTASVTDGLGANRVVATASVNTATFHPASQTTVGATPFLLYIANPQGVNEASEFNRGGLELDAGTTEYQKVNVEVATGELIIQFDIRDLGDGFLDSAVLIDNVELTAIDVLDPRDDMIDEFSGNVVSTASARNARLIASGTPVRGVAADGVTQVIVRSNVSGPGAATFTVTSDPITDGSLSASDGQLLWGATAHTSAVRINGKWYVFALYRSPPDFNRGGDQAATKRTATLSMTFTPQSGAAVSQSVTLDVIRPPVVVVPDMWSTCVNWLETGSVMRKDPTTQHFVHPFTLSCAEYRGTSSKSFNLEDNQRVVADAIEEALAKLRDTGMAVTQADVIGHGTGGLLARRYIESANFIRFDNFNAGPIGRLITMNTPHLGSRLADEIVRTRNSAKRDDPDHWTNDIKPSLARDGVLIDDADGDLVVDELRSNSAIINDLGKNVFPTRSVRYHALVTDGGRDVPRLRARPLLTQSAKSLYDILETQHPLTIELISAVDKQRLILGPTSAVFCTAATATSDDQHDLFATTWEQRGGLEAPFFTTVALRLNPSGHFKAQIDERYEARLVELLDAPRGGGLFAASMPRPDSVQRINNCPIEIPDPRAARSAMAEPRAAVQGTIAITSPAPGTRVAPGGQVTIAVTATGPAQPELVRISGMGDAVELDAPPFTATLVVSKELVGPVAVHATAFYPRGGMALARPVEVVVQTPATVTDLEVLGSDVVLQRPGRARAITVLGTYSDGVQREVTRAAVGTVYIVSQLTPVAEVSPDGLITAIGPGNATVAMRNGTAVTSIDVEVGEPTCGDGVLDPGEACDDGNVQSGDRCDAVCAKENAAPLAVCTSPTACNDPGLCAASVTDLAAASSDPDGDPLSITQSPPGPYAVGTHEVTVDVSDGELAAVCTAQLSVLDCEPPALTCPAGFAMECTGDGAAHVTPPGATATDNCGATLQPPAGGPLALGAHELTYAAADPSGNAASCTTTVTVQDTVPPAIACPSPVIAECTGARHASVDPGAASATDTCTDPEVIGPEATSYALGTTAVTFAAVDRSGNRSRCATTVTVQDTTAPSLTCPAPRLAECTGDGHAVVDPGDASASDGCTTATVSAPGARAFALGETTVDYDAVDEAGNRARCATRVTVQDTTPPQLSCPPPQVAECTGRGSAVVDPGRATAADVCGASVVSQPAPGSYPLGTTTVAYTAHDDAGNQASCETPVTVQDTTPPALTCPPPIVAECTGQSRAFVQPRQAASSDVCGDVTVDGPRRGFFPLGATAVTYTSRDEAGHQATCSSTIEVVDTRAPRLTVDRSVSLWPADHQYRTVRLADCGIDVVDRCGGRLAPDVYRAALTCVTSDEPDDARGDRDGNTTRDIVIVDDTTVRLRAERHATRDGRVYKLHFQVRDAADNTSNGVCAVTVPRDGDCRRRWHGDRDCRADDDEVESSVCR